MIMYFTHPIHPKLTLIFPTYLLNLSPFCTRILQWQRLTFINGQQKHNNLNFVHDQAINICH